ncbi:PRA1 family protein D-like [Impatiens glandulifera]|uniref:PRA1 family protein D-like n=1 Tax=Impatiens glandulifera TaxID=253017 RepID=UPI001FB0B860|nr:PRA1 family protein D-like [Impatiens glandulifera]
MAAASTPAGGYTNIPPMSNPLHQLPTDFSSRAAQIHHSFASALRPWREFLDINVISPPISLSEATFRVRKNLHYFRLNYTLLSLLVLFLSLLFHPISLIVFLITFAAWLHFYFYRDEPVTIFDHQIHDLAVLIVLSLVTIIALMWTGVWLNVLVSVLIAGGLICFHGAMRFTDDFDEASPYGSLLDSPRGSYSQV